MNSIKYYYEYRLFASTFKEWHRVEVSFKTLEDARDMALSFAKKSNKHSILEFRYIKSIPASEEIING